MKRFIQLNRIKRIIFIALLLFLTPAWAFARDSSDSRISIQEKLKRMEKIIQELEKKQKAQEVMNQLQQTDEEKKEKEEDILDAAGREYTLANPGTVNISYSIAYTGDTYDQIRQLTDENDKTSTEVKHINAHDLTNSLNIKYPIKSNITFSTNLPFDARYSSSTKDSKKGIGIGDPSITFQYQPFKAVDKYPTTILSAGLTIPLGSNPYRIDPDDEIATGNGRYAISTGINFSKTIDPVIAYGGISYFTYFPVTGLEFNSDQEQKAQGIHIYEVDSGDSIAANIGMGFSLSYIVSISIGFQYSHSQPTKYYWKNVGKMNSSSSSSSTLSIGTNWRLSPKRSINTDLSIGLYNNNSDVSFTLSIPFEFRI